MFYYLSQQFGNDWIVLNLFRYITFRTMAAILTALALTLWMGPSLIRWLKRRQKEGQPIRDDGPQAHLETKKGTPTMGGLMILSALAVTTLLWGNLINVFVWLVMFVTLSFGAIGFWDDYLKVAKRNSKGLSARAKLVSQTVITFVMLWFLIPMLPVALQTTLMVPFFKTVAVPLGILFVPFAWCVLVGASNAVNLTDGLDGLLIGPAMIVSACFAVIAYVVGNQIFANYLQLAFVPGAGELTVLCGGLIGAGLGFLWFNAPPAKIFMGDTGSLALGGFFGAIALVTKHELVLLIVGGLFVMEAVSVMLQVGYFKWTKGKRIFLMTPIHHHFEKKGWSEATIVFRFWIISIVFALIGLSTLKLR